MKLEGLQNLILRHKSRYGGIGQRQTKRTAQQIGLGQVIFEKDNSVEKDSLFHKW